MKRVWKCDHCSKTDLDPDKISLHEPKCSFNKATKYCYTCKFSYESGYGGEHFPGCEIKLDVYKGEDEGNCSGWVYRYLEEERDEKLNELGL
jgi:hypothetical protein